MNIIDNISRTLKDDLMVELKKDSRVSIAAACFSMYAYRELKEQFEGVAELRFIFTSPAFIAEKTSRSAGNSISHDLTVKRAFTAQSLR
jgi:hypothetical protein